MITKEEYAKLAEACVRQDRYENDLIDCIGDIAKRYNQDNDFLGLPALSDGLITAVCEVLGDDFEYLLYECNGSFDTFNENVTLEDGTHPNLRDFGDLYNFAKRYEERK